MSLGWDDIRTIGLMVRHGTLAGAAEALGVTYTTVSRRLARAEAALGETLFERLADGFRPTEAARLIARHAGSMEAAELTLSRQLAGRDGRLSGVFTVTAPELLIGHVLAPVLESFQRANPQVELRIRASNELLDLDRREADLAVRVSRSPGDTLKGLRLTAQHSASFAAPVWAERIAEDPSGPIDWLVYEAYPALPEAVMAHYPGSRVACRFDDMSAMAGAAAAGLGVLRCPMFLGRSLPGLVQVPLLPPQPYADIWVVGHADLWDQAKARAFRAHLIPFMKARRALFMA